MRQQVLAEMEHIPRHPKQHQSDLRMAYWLLRMQSLDSTLTVKHGF